MPKRMSDLLDVDFNDINNMNKNQTSKYADKILKEIEPKRTNVKMLKRMQTKGRLNTQTSEKLKDIADLVGVYKKGKNKGKLKSTKYLSKQQTLDIIRLGRTILRKDIYTKKGRKWKEESANEAYKTFHSGKVTGKQKKLLNEDYERIMKQRSYSREDFDKLVEVYNLMGDKMLEQYSSTQLYSVYDTIKEAGVEISAHTIFDIIDDKISQGFVQEELADEVWYEIDRLVNPDAYDDDDIED